MELTTYTSCDCCTSTASSSTYQQLTTTDEVPVHTPAHNTLSANHCNTLSAGHCNTQLLSHNGIIQPSASLCENNTNECTFSDSSPTNEAQDTQMYLVLLASLTDTDGIENNSCSHQQPNCGVKPSSAEELPAKDDVNLLTNATLYARSPQHGELEVSDNTNYYQTIRENGDYSELPDDNATDIEYSELADDYYATSNDNTNNNLTAQTQQKRWTCSGRCKWIAFGVIVLLMAIVVAASVIARTLLPHRGTINSSTNPDSSNLTSTESQEKRPRLLEARFKQNITIPYLLNAYHGHTAIVTLSTFHNQLLIDNSESSELYIYNTTNNAYTYIYNITKPPSLGQPGQRQSFADIAWISSNRAVCIIDYTITVVEMPSLSVISPLKPEGTKLYRISVYNNSLLYVAKGRFGVLESINGGLSWSQTEHVKPNGWVAFQATHVPHPYRTTWTLEANGTCIRVCIYDEVHVKKPRSPSREPNVVFNQTYLAPYVNIRTTNTQDEYFLKLAYDDRNNVIMADHYNRTVHVFDITGRYTGYLRLTGVDWVISPRSMAVDVDNQILYLGMAESYIMVVELIHGLA